MSDAECPQTTDKARRADESETRPPSKTSAQSAKASAANDPSPAGADGAKPTPSAIPEPAPAPAADGLDFSNTNRWDTRQLVTMALLCAIASLLSFVQIPLIPAASFLTYDASLMPAMVCGFAYGPGAGIAVGAIAAIIHGLILGEWVGSLMNIVAALCFIWPAAVIYRRKHTFAGGILGLCVGVLAATAGAFVSNLTIGVAFWYGSADVILPLMLPAVLPFNLAKGIVNSVLTLIVYKAVSNLITPEKDQVKGRGRA